MPTELVAQVGTICGSGWSRADISATLISRLALHHPLTQVVLTCMTTRGRRVERHCTGAKNLGFRAARFTQAIV